MKKLIIFVLILTFASMGALVGCSKDKGDEGIIRLNEVTHSVFYAPLYVAINNGYFEEEGLTIELTNGGGSDKTMTAILTNEADMGLLGPEPSIYVKLQGSSNYPLIVGRLTKCDGSFLIGRTAEPSFKWSDLEGKEIIGGRKGGMPATCLEHVMKKEGVYDKATINYDIQFDLITAAFEGGTGDYCTMFEPGASQYEKQGKGHIIASIGDSMGAVPYTCFMANRSYLENNPQKVESFITAIMKGVTFVLENSEEAIADSLQASFPTTDKSLLASSVKRYKSIDAYMPNLVLDEDSFNNLQDVLEESGTISKRVAFSDMVDNTFAEKVLK